MDNTEFLKVWKVLGKTRGELACLWSVSPKTIEIFEQGWREIPASVEHQLLLPVSLKLLLDRKHGHCWEIRNCTTEWSDLCRTWEYKAGHFCWFINGTFCQGKFQDDRDKKWNGADSVKFLDRLWFKIDLWHLHIVFRSL